MKLRSQFGATTRIAIALVFLLSGNRVCGGEGRSPRTSHKIHITDKDFQQINDASSSSNDPRRYLKWEYHLNVHGEDGIITQRDGGNSTSEYLLALHFSSFSLDPRCTMEIRDASDELVSKVAGMGTFWSQHIKGLSANISLGCTDDTSVKEEQLEFKSTIVMDEYVVIHINTVHYSEEARRKLLEEKSDGRNLEICRDSELKNARCFETSHPDAVAAANAVVRMQYGNDFCTGWMVSPGLLMTAAHCVLTEEEVMNTVYQFDYASEMCDSDIFAEPEYVKPVVLEFIDMQSDFAMIRLEGNPGFKYGYLTMDKVLPSVNDAVYIPQHPAGRDMELGIFERHPAVPSGLCSVQSNGQESNDRTCALYGATSFKDFVVFCDTEGGSSGAPVLSATTNKVIGIHHCGSSCENFAVPIIHIHSAVIGLVNYDIVSAVEPTPTFAPSVGPTVTNDAAPGTLSGASTLLPSLGWRLALLLLASSSIILVI